MLVTRADALARTLEDVAGQEELRPGRWSVVEYGGHVRDVLVVQRERVIQTRLTDTPRVAPMGRDERTTWGEYDGLDAADLCRQIRDAADWLARSFAGLEDAEWSRTLYYNYPSPAERSLGWLAARTVHELVHHELDIRRASPSGSAG